MKRFHRRQFLLLGADAAALSAASRLAWAQTLHPLAERLAVYADSLGYDHLDDATVERVKMHLIDSLGCGLAAFDEKPVRICRDLVLASGGGGATVIGTNRRAAPDLATFANCAAFRYLE